MVFHKLKLFKEIKFYLLCWKCNFLSSMVALSTFSFLGLKIQIQEKVPL